MKLNNINSHLEEIAKQFSEAIKYTNPSLEMAKQISEVLSYTSPTQELIKQMSEAFRYALPTFEMHNTLSEALKIANPSLEISKHLAESFENRNSFLEMSKQLTETLKTIHIPNYLSNFNTAIDEIVSFQKTFSHLENLKNIKLPKSKILNQLDNLTKNISDHYINIEDYLEDGFKITDENIINIPEEITTNIDFEDKLNLFLEKIEINQKNRDEVIINEIRNTKETKFKKFLNIFFFPLVISGVYSLIGTIKENYIEPEILRHKSIFRNYIQAEIIYEIEKKAETKFTRFVNSEYLEVKLKNYGKSKTIIKLKFGEIVILKNRKKDWSLIQKKDNEGNIILEGWVLSRYLEK